VVVRSSARAPGIARALALAEVPTRLTGGGVPLRDDSASRALLTIVEVGIGRVELSPSIAAELLLGPFGGVDPIGLRRLRLALRHEEVAGGGARQSGELLVEALRKPAGLATLDTSFTKRAARMAATLAALRERAQISTAEELLWLAWERSGVAADWRAQALGAGLAAAEANRNLDGVVALFSSAKRFSERRPDAGVDDFLAELLDSEVPDDVLAPRRADDAVLVTTPSGVVGLEFRTVVVAGLQDGVWPNLRLRGSLLSPHRLVRVVTEGEAPLDERKLVLDDELRMFALAVSRASERVVLSAVVNDDETGSVLFSLVPPGTPTLDTASVVPLTLRGVTGRLRRTLTEPARPEIERREAAATLARLAEAGVVGAGPADWLGLIEPSTTGPLFDGEEVPISPSRLESFEESPLDWFLDTVAGSTSSTAMNVGTILHWAMETATDPSVDAIWAAVESRWDELVFEAPWLAEHQRRATRVLAHGIAEYLRDFGAEGKQLVAAEGRFRFPLDGAEGSSAAVNGSIDRVERAPDGSVVIVDLKTGTPITSQSVVDAHPQLGIYQLAYREGLLDEFLAEHGEHRPGGAKLLYVKKGIGGKAYREGVQAALDDAGLEGFRDRIRQAAIGMAAAGFDGLAEPRSFGPGLAELGLRLARVAEVSGD
jgi:RecB family exonuclease